jgi:sulfate transport system ATP-binding protein
VEGQARPEDGVSISIRNVSKHFGTFAAVDAVSLEVAPGELVALLGPSGSGKTTLLRLIAGLDLLDTGSILLDGEDASRRTARERRVGFVFQHYALFRHMSVFENVAFGLRVKPRRSRPAESDIRRKVMALLEMVHLEVMAHRMPSQLSGGQRQRVALARALAVEPRVLLLDEPFGALDAKVRQDLRRWLRRLHDELQVTTVLVTHDQEEALELADRVVVLNRGRVEQIGTPQDVYERPATAFVCGFLGDVNLFHSRVEGGRIFVGPVPIPALDGRQTGEAVSVYVRPHALSVRATRDNGHQFRARVIHVNAAGPTVKMELLAEWGRPLRVEMPQDRYRALGLRPDSEVYVSPDPSGVFVHAAAHDPEPPEAESSARSR